MYGVWPSPLSYMDINGCFIIRSTNGEMTIPQELGCNPIFLTMANGYGLQMVYPKQSRVCTQKNNEFVSPLPVPVLWAQCAFKRSTGWICFYGWSKQIAASWTSQMHGNSSKLWGPPRAIAVIFALWSSKNCIENEAEKWWVPSTNPWCCLLAELRCGILTMLKYTPILKKNQNLHL